MLATEFAIGRTSEGAMSQTYLAGPIERLRRSWRRARERWRTIDELAACPANELRRIAADVGVSGEQLYGLSRNPTGPSELLPQRLRLLGIDADYVRQAMPTTFRDLARVCAACQSARRCRRDLNRGDAQSGQDSYCLNGLSIDALTLNTDHHKLPGETRRAACNGG
jgi:hypothetical protein